jgi:ribosomal protein S17
MPPSKAPTSTRSVRSLEMFPSVTIVTCRDYLHYIPKYKCYEKRHKNIHAPCSPCFPIKEEGDIVIIGQCRPLPLAKTGKFNSSSG